MLFLDYPNTTYWKVELTAETISNGVPKSGTGTIVLKTNQPPYNGTCTVISSLRGYALESNFTINCTNWIDDDGYITTYEFFGSFFELYNMK